MGACSTKLSQLHLAWNNVDNKAREEGCSVWLTIFVYKSSKNFYKIPESGETLDAEVDWPFIWFSSLSLSLQVKEKYYYEQRSMR